MPFCINCGTEKNAKEDICPKCGFYIPPQINAITDSEVISLYYGYLLESMGRIIDVPDISRLERYDSFVDYMNTLPDHNRLIAETHLNQYLSSDAINIRLKYLIDYFHDTGITPKTIIDFGCGNGDCLDRLRQLYPCKVYGIDPYSIISNPHVIRYDYIQDIHITTDVFLAIFSLHHVDYDYQHDVLHQAYDLLTENGILYIIEDTWGEIDVQQDIDRDFILLDDSQKMLLYRLNEYWSNRWFYNNNCNIENVYYRSMSSWIRLLQNEGFTVLRSNCRGFDYNRLHGVPSGWILAKK